MYKGIPLAINPFKDWILVISVVSLIIAISAYYLKPKLYRRILSSAFNPVETEKIRYEKNRLINRISFLLNITFIINIVLFAFLALDFFNVFEITWYSAFAYILTGVVVFYILRYSIYLLTAWVTDSMEPQANYILAWMSLNKIFGLVLTPGILILLYSDYTVFNKYLIYFYLGLYGLFFIYKLYRGLIIAAEKRISLLHIFLYFCTLEFIPVSGILKHGAEMI